MMIVSLLLAPQARHFVHGHGIVITFVARAAVIAASALLATTGAGAPAARQAQAIAAESPAPKAPKPPYSVCRPTFDSSPESDRAPGLAPLPAAPDSRASTC
jgi:hypothetical protein